MSRAPHPADRAAVIGIASRAWTRRRGLQGNVVAFLTPQGLVLEGERGGHLLIQPGQVLRLRSGWTRTKHGRIHQTRLWTEGSSDALLLDAFQTNAPAYTSLVQGFATQVDAAQGILALERGTTLPVILYGSLYLLIFVLVCLAIAFVMPPGSAWWVRALPIGVAGVLLLIVLAEARIHWPRPVRHLGEFFAQV